MRALGLLLLVGLAPFVGAESFEFDFRGEAGSFNRAYQDRNYVTATSVTFGVPYGALGFEGTHRDDDGNTWSLGVAQTTIGEGQVYNRDRWEQQPLTLVNFAGLSIGKDGGWWEAGLGVGALVQVRDFGAQTRFLADGQPVTVRSGGLDWNRRKSFTVITALLRLLPVTQPHLALSIARGPLSLTENLMHVKGVLPLGGSQLDAEIGFSSPLGLVFHDDGQLVSNERVSLGWSVGNDSGRIGLRLGVLLRALVEGAGEVDLAHRLSFAVDWSVGSPYGSTFPAAR